MCDSLSFTPLSLVYLFTYPFVFLSLSPPPFLTRFVSMCLCFSLSPLLPLTLSTNSPICLFVFVSLSDSVYLFTCVCFSLSHPLSLWLSLPIYISVCLFLSLSLTLPTHSSICLCVFISFSHPYLPIQVSSLSPSLFDSLSTYLPIWGSKPLWHKFPPSVIWKSACNFFHNTFAYPIAAILVSMDSCHRLLHINGGIMSRNPLKPPFLGPDSRGEHKMYQEIVG